MHHHFSGNPGLFLVAVFLVVVALLVSMASDQKSS